MTRQAYPVCNLQDIDDPGSRAFTIELNNDSIEGFVVSSDGQFYAYLNRCPHTGSPLDWVEHQFLDREGVLIQCAVHDARFTIEDGICIAGPCVGDQLQKLSIELREDQLYLLL